MKMSEFTTKSFLGNAGAAENSYILINYEDNTTQRPITYKASLQEIGKAIANDQKLYKKTQNGAVTTNVSQGAYVNGTAEVFASTGAVTAAVSGLASTGYVTAAVANAGGNDGFTNDGDIPVYVGASDGDLKWYNWADPADYTPYPVVKTNGAPLVVYNSTSGRVGYFADVSDAYMTPLSLGDETDLTGYLYADFSLAGDYTLKFQAQGEDNPITVTPAMIGAIGANALNGLASTGYVTNAISTAMANAGGGGFDPTAAVTCEVYPVPGDSNPQSWSLYPVMVAPSTDEVFTYDRGEKGYFPRAFVSNGLMTSAISTATSGLASTGYVDTALNNILYYTTDTSNNIWLQDKEGNSLIVFRYNSTNDTYTPEVPHN